MSGSATQASAKPDTAAVCGASGFIGSRLAATLEQRGVRVARFAKSTPILTAGGGLAPGLAEASTVFYLATSLSPAVAEQSPELVTTEREFFTELLGRLRKEGRHPAIVLASSGGTVYDPSAHPPYREDTPALPSTAYGRAKRDLERDLLSWDRALIPLILRLANVYGPGQPATRGYGVLPHWLRALADGSRLRVFGSPRSRRDYVHVDDVVDAMARLHFLDTADLPRILNVGSGRPTALVELLALVVEVAGRSVTAEFAEARPFDRHDSWLDPTEAERHLGWHARIHLEEGVRETWERVLRDTPTPEGEH
jgi:UDP-glucose 4-epimerase